MKYLRQTAANKYAMCMEVCWQHGLIRPLRYGRQLFLSEYGMGSRIFGEQRGMQKGGTYPLALTMKLAKDTAI